MKISTWRTQVRQWMAQRLSPDSWELSTPISPGKTVGYIEPLRDIEYSFKGQLEASASQHIYLLARYPSTLLFDQLPLNTLEGLHSNISQYLITDWLSFGIESLEYSMLDQPIKVMESGDGMGEWIVELHWLTRFTWLPELETNSDTGISLYRVNFGLYREMLDGSAVVLDTDLSVQSTMLTKDEDMLTNNEDILTYG